MKKTIYNTLLLYKQVILTILVLAVFGDIVLLKSQSDFVLFGLLIVYCGFLFIYRLSSIVTFRVSLFVLAVMSLAFITTSTSVITERAAVWLFFLILTGVIQQIKE